MPITLATLEKVDTWSWFVPDSTCSSTLTHVFSYADSKNHERTKTKCRPFLTWGLYLFDRAVPAVLISFDFRRHKAQYMPCLETINLIDLLAVA